MKKSSMNRSRRWLNNQVIPNSVVAKVGSNHSRISTLTSDDDQSIPLPGCGGDSPSTTGSTVLDPSCSPRQHNGRKKLLDESGGAQLHRDDANLLHRIQRFESNLSPTPESQLRRNGSASLSSTLPVPMPVRKASARNLQLSETMQQGTDDKHDMRNATFTRLSSSPQISKPAFGTMKLNDKSMGIRPELVELSTDLFQTVSPPQPPNKSSLTHFVGKNNALCPFGKSVKSSPTPPLKPKRCCSPDQTRQLYC